MQNNFECIFELIVAFNIFNVCCLFALSIFLFNVLHYIFIFMVFFFFFYFLERKTAKRKKKERKKQRK